MLKADTEANERSLLHAAHGRDELAPRVLANTLSMICHGSYHIKHIVGVFF